MKFLQRVLAVLLLSVIGFGWVVEAAGPCADDDGGACCVLCGHSSANGLVVSTPSASLRTLNEQPRALVSLSSYSPLFISDIFQPPRLA